jgi:5-oxoprolinase (ATP-hydrolysing)
VVRGIYQPLQHCPAESIDEVAGQLGAEATELLRQEHEDSGDIRLQLECDLRYQGTDAALTVELEPKSTLADRFHRAHHDTFGYVQPDRTIQLVVIRCEAILQTDSSSNCVDVQRSDHGERRTAIELTRIWHASQWIEASLIDRHTLVIGQEVAAPAMIVGPHSTLVVEPGWTKARSPCHRAAANPISSCKESYRARLWKMLRTIRFFWRSSRDGCKASLTQWAKCFAELRSA